MASTNTTANYGLPQYVANDKPTYLGDFNAAMLSIDTAIKGVSDIATANQTGLASLDTTVEDQGERLGTVEAETTVNTSDIATANQNITNLQSLTSTQGQQIATVTQTANASALVIGSGALSTEADKIIPAINEVNNKIKQPQILATVNGANVTLESSNVSYSEYMLAVKWGANGSYTGVVSIPKVIWNAPSEDPIRIPLNNRPDGEYVEVVYRGVSDSSVWCTISHANANVYTSLIGIR